MTSISQNTYIDIANKYNNTFHSTIRTKSIVVKPTKYVESSREVNSKDILNLKLLVLLEFQNIETFLQKAMFQIDLKNVL